jgi:hypothetical protein
MKRLIIGFAQGHHSNLADSHLYRETKNSEFNKIHNNNKSPLT